MTDAISFFVELGAALFGLCIVELTSERPWIGAALTGVTAVGIFYLFSE